MRHLNNELTGLMGFLLPEVYVVDSIDDFVSHRNEIIGPSRLKKLLNPAHWIIAPALIYLHNIDLKLTDDLRKGDYLISDLTACLYVNGPFWPGIISTTLCVERKPSLRQIWPFSVAL